MPDIGVTDGRLSFKSKEAFDKTVQLLVSQQNQLEEFERKFSGFTSVRTAFSQLKDQDYEKISTEGVTKLYEGYVVIVDEANKTDKEIRCTITDPILATLVSQDGWLYIGKDAYRLTYDKFQLIRNRSAEKIASVMAEKVATPDVISGVVSHKPKTLANTKAAGSEHCIHDYFDGSNKRRLAGDIDYVFYDGAGVGTMYESLTIYTKHQRRNFGTYWTQYPTTKLGMSGSVTKRFTAGGTETPDSFSFEINNTDQISKSYSAVCTDIPGPNGGRICDVVYRNISSTHTGIATTGANLNCGITLPS